MKKQTAIEWLEDKINDELEIYNNQWLLIESFIEQALEIEKEQIEDAYKEGRSSGQANWGFGNDTTSEEYFKETYKK